MIINSKIYRSGDEVEKEEFDNLDIVHIEDISESTLKNMSRSAIRVWYLEKFGRKEKR